MAQHSGFFNAELVDSKPDRLYLAEEFAQFFGQFIGNGVFAANANNLQIVEMATPSMNVIVRLGSAFINGYWFESDADLELSIDIASGVNERKDLVVVRWDLTKRDIYIDVVKGEPAAVAVRPEITRNNTIFELGLAEIHLTRGATSISNLYITDLRFDSAYCGIVSGLVDQIDMTELFAQYQAAFNLLRDNTNKQFQAMFTDYTNRFNTLETNTKADLQKLLSDYTKSFNDLITSQTTRFNNMFADYTTQFDKLKTDTASQLKTMMDNYKSIFDKMQTDNNAAFQTMFTEMQKQFDESQATNKQDVVDMLNSFQSTFTSNETQRTNDFNDWFEKMKGQLTTDAAGNLQTQIDKINEEISLYNSLPTNIVDTEIVLNESVTRIPTVRGRLEIDAIMGRCILDGIPNPDNEAGINYVGESTGTVTVATATSNLIYDYIEDAPADSGLTVTGSSLSGTAAKPLTIEIGYINESAIVFFNGKNFTFSNHGATIPDGAKAIARVVGSTTPLFELSGITKSVTNVIRANTNLEIVLDIQQGAIFDNYDTSLFQLEYGNFPTAYVKYDYGRTSINVAGAFSRMPYPSGWSAYNRGLFSLPDGRADGIYLNESSRYNSYRNVVCAILNSSVDWRVGTVVSNSNTVIFEIDLNSLNAAFKPASISNQCVLSTFFSSYDARVTQYQQNIEGFWYGKNVHSSFTASNMIYLQINKSRVGSTVNATTIKNYLDSKQLMFYYKLDTAYTTRTETYVFRLYKDASTIFVGMYAMSAFNNNNASLSCIVGPSRKLTNISTYIRPLPAGQNNTLTEFQSTELYYLSANEKASNLIKIPAISFADGTTVGTVGLRKLQPNIPKGYSFTNGGITYLVYAPSVRVEFSGTSQTNKNDMYMAVYAIVSPDIASGTVRRTEITVEFHYNPTYDNPY